MPIEFKIASLRVPINLRLTNSQTLKIRLASLKALAESRRMSTQHIVAIQRWRKIIFDKWHKKLNLRPGVLVLLQDARKLDFHGKVDVVRLRPYFISKVFSNNSVKLETWNGECFPVVLQTVDVRGIVLIL